MMQFLQGENLLGALLNMFLIALFLVPLIISSAKPNAERKPSDRTETLGGAGPAVICYVRVSSSSQVNGFSIADQEARLKEMAIALGASKIYWYYDPGKTATKEADRKISKMLAAKHEGKANTLLVVSVDRISRQTINSMLFFLDFCSEGGTLRTPKAVYTPDDLSSLLLYLIESYMAEKDNKQRSEKANGGKIRAFDAGFWMNYTQPYGYNKVPTSNFNSGKTRYKIEKNSESGPVVDFIFRQYVKTKSFAAVRKDLLDKFNLDLPAPLIARILDNPIYTGDPELMGHTYHDNSLRHIDRALFDQVQNVLEEQHKIHKHKSNEVFEEIVSQDMGAFWDLIEHWNEHQKQFPGHILRDNGTRNNGCQIAFACFGAGHKAMQWRWPHVRKATENLHKQTSTSPLTPFTGFTTKLATAIHHIKKKPVRSTSLFSSENLDFYE